MPTRWVPAVLLLFAVAFVGVTLASAQAPTPPQYVGSRACAGCHSPEHASWADTWHSRVVQTATRQILLADFAGFTDVITTPRQKYEARDVLFTIGGRHYQRYLVRDPKSRRLVVGAGQWNVRGQGDNRWEPAPAGDDWLDKCAGCHTTGYNPRTDKYVELGVGCEACHGPGNEHVTSPSLNPIPVGGVKAMDAALCGQCHTRGSSPEVDGEQYPYPLDYVPGQALTDKNFVPVKPTGLVTDTNWWNDEHAKQSRQQYPEWMNSGHAQALTTLQKVASADETCLSCHSADAASLIELTGPALTVKTAQFGVTCQVCHAVHPSGAPSFSALLRRSSNALCTACHNGTAGSTQPLVPGAPAHRSVQEMYEGQGGLDVQDEPSPHLGPNGPTCAACHMPKGAAPTHNWNIVMPGQAQSGQPNACSACHTNPQSQVMQLGAGALQGLIDTRQAEIKAKIDKLTKQLKDVKSAHAAWDPKADKKSETQVAFEKALANVSLVAGEGSYGVHNYGYAHAVLAKAEEQLRAAMVTPTPTPEPTRTPEPTSTPIPPPPTPTPVPPPSGGAGWPVWIGLVAVAALVVVVLLARHAHPG